MNLIGLTYIIRKLGKQIIDFDKLSSGPSKVIDYIKDWRKYSRMGGAELIGLINANPILHEKKTYTEIDSHYFYQDIWAFKKILESHCEVHVDIGSNIKYVGFLSAITKVTFIDIRPLLVNLENFDSKRGTILSIPYEDNSVPSLSCLHVAEHIGLGRYGDPLDPLGTKKAAKELSRILAPNGNLFFSLPIGKPRVCFNAHRIHSTDQILNYFSKLELKELSGINDEGRFIKDIDENILNSCNYGCGLFWFIKT